MQHWEALKGTGLIEYLQGFWSGSLEETSHSVEGIWLTRWRGRGAMGCSEVKVACRDVDDECFPELDWTVELESELVCLSINHNAETDTLEYLLEHGEESEEGVLACADFRQLVERIAWLHGIATTGQVSCT